MTYVYDLILNFNSELYEFYEWEKNDNIVHIKRINLVKISSKMYNDLLDKEICFTNDFMFNIFNKCEYFLQKRVKSFPYAFLVTDSYRIMALFLNNKGIVTKYSSLLLDEEEDVLEISNGIPLVKIEYNIVNVKEKRTLTRNEAKIIKYIKKDLNDSYYNKDLSKLKYMYYEYFNRENEDCEYIYKTLMDELNKEINDKHYNLYNLVKLSLSNKI